MEEVHGRLARGGLARGGSSAVLDVRSWPEFASGHLPGAIHAPVDEVVAEPSRLAEGLRDHDAVYVHCAKGARAARAVAALRDAGLGNVWHVKGGVDEWKQQGHDVERVGILGAAFRHPWLSAVAVGAAAGLGATLAAAAVRRLRGA